MNGNTIGFHPQTHKLEVRTKQTVQHETEITAEEVSFEWPDCKILSADSKVRTTSQVHHTSVRYVKIHTWLRGLGE